MDNAEGETIMMCGDFNARSSLWDPVGQVKRDVLYRTCFSTTFSFLWQKLAPYTSVSD